ncbi:hypothetical protein MVES_001765 [Malassezia vespertilionis]|uniref:Protein kinase domain-containing protein n=1 Tax=Malassezia vespertilionis TaxID=2020962 RepID=A0A2N1JDI6_9BASI|nr:hypothetical protein MVES_001765 [Malassezia vespertilionis]
MVDQSGHIGLGNTTPPRHAAKNGTANAAQSPHARKGMHVDAEEHDGSATSGPAPSKRERTEWEKNRGAGSSVILWHEHLREKDPEAWREFNWTALDVVPSIAKVLQMCSNPVEVVGMDRLLDWGITDYTILPRVLGRGRFSTVYLAVKNNTYYAIKHTALFPHHELVATRLLREPRLLAELPPHPNLVTVTETIRTPGHFYLVEEYLEGYITLEQLIPRRCTTKSPTVPVLPLADAEKIFKQLVLVLYAIHWPLRVCHRDVKPENVMVHPETLHLKLLDFGLATHFSKSRAKLTTCCGSPAFHCPEIVAALASPPGYVAYWGPEVDAWTCGMTMLRCLSGIRYPLGTSHTTSAAMASRAKQVLRTFPQSALRDNIALLLDTNGERRMRNFKDLAEHFLQSEPSNPIARNELKSTTFIPTVPQHSISLPLLRTQAPSTRVVPSALPLPGMGQEPLYTELTLLNVTKQPPGRIMSFIKYALRCAGILFQVLPGSDTSDMAHATALHCVVELTDGERDGPWTNLLHSVMSILGQPNKDEPYMVVPTRSKSVKSTAVLPENADSTVKPCSGPSGKQGSLTMLAFNLLIVFPSAAHDETATPHDGMGTFVARMGGTADRAPISQPAAAAASPEGANTPLPWSGAADVVHAYVSNQRAVPYVRGALSCGGIREQETPPLPKGVSPTASANKMLSSENAYADPLGPDALLASLHNIQSSLTAVLALEEGQEDTASLDRLNRRMLYLCTRITGDLADTSRKEAVISTLQAYNFEALETLAPALALVEEKAKRENALETKERAESTGSLALTILELFAQHSSAKEMLLGVQEQIEFYGGALYDEASGPPMRKNAQLLQTILGLLQLLLIVIPMVKAKKPSVFLEPVLELLSPKLYVHILPTALHAVDTVDTREELATQSVVVLCELLLSIRAWCKRQGSEGMLLDLGTMLIQGLHAMHSYLPYIANGTSKRDRNEAAAEHVTGRVTVWNIVRKTCDMLHLNLVERAFPPKGARHSVQEARRAFLVLAQQLAYELFVSRVQGRSRNRLRYAMWNAEVLGDPMLWTPSIARELLDRCAEVFPTMYLAELGTLHTLPSPALLEAATEVQQTDMMIAFVQWSLDALHRSDATHVLPDTTTEHLTRTLAFLAVVTPLPLLRHQAFLCTSKLLQDYSSADATVAMLQEMLAPLSPQPLRTATVNLVRTICFAHITALERAKAIDAAHDPLFAHGRLWSALQGMLFVLPHLAPRYEDHDALRELESFLVDHRAYLQECCVLYYLISCRDVHNYTGLDVHQVSREFIGPLAAFVHGWEQFCATHHDVGVAVRNEIMVLDDSVTQAETSMDRDHVKYTLL